MTEETYEIGSIPLCVRALDDAAAHGIPAPFIALVPALDLERLPAALSIVPPLLAAGCSNVILAGPRAEDFRGQLTATTTNTTAAQISPYEDVNDACNAALLATMLSKAGIALCADEPSVLEALRGVAAMNGWTRTTDTASPAVESPWDAGEEIEFDDLFEVTLPSATPDLSALDQAPEAAPAPSMASAKAAKPKAAKPKAAAKPKSKPKATKSKATKPKAAAKPKAKTKPTKSKATKPKPTKSRATKATKSRR